MRSLIIWLFSYILHFELLQTCIAIPSQAYHDSTWKPGYVLVATQEVVSRNCQTRTSIVFNGTSPGPAIYLMEGETTWVRVHNRIPNKNLTVHWHGLTMKTAPFSDGTPLVSQWPIPYGHFFDYEVHPEMGDAGTYFYHSHEGFQAVTAHGPLIVQDASNPRYQYDDEIPLIVGDWYTKTDSEIESSLTGQRFDWPGGPEALVVSQRSRTQPIDETDGSCGPSVITVKPETTYRIRWTSASALAYAIIDLEDHTNLTIIEVDGRYSKPAQTDHIQLGSGQRFSSLFTSKSQSELDADGKGGEYWINYRTPDGPAGYLTGKALLKYDTGKQNKRSSRHHNNHPTARPHEAMPGKPGVTVKDDSTTWLEYTLESLDAADFPTLSEVTRMLQINITMDMERTGMLKFQLNDLSWDEAKLKSRPGAIPYLIDAYLNKRTPDYDTAIANYGWDPETWGFPVRVGEVIDIVWQQTNVDPRQSYDYHPMHAHGERYWDLGAGSGDYDPVENEKRFANYTPAQRDTTMLYSYNGDTDESTSGWRAWRVKVTEQNVGAWIMHCHVLHHMVMGMQTIWVFGDAAAILKKLPEPYIDGYLEFGGSAYGNDTFDPIVLSYF